MGQPGQPGEEVVGEVEVDQLGQMGESLQGGSVMANPSGGQTYTDLFYTVLV